MIDCMFEANKATTIRCNETVRSITKGTYLNENTGLNHLDAWWASVGQRNE